MNSLSGLIKTGFHRSFLTGWLPARSAVQNFDSPPGKGLSGLPVPDAGTVLKLQHDLFLGRVYVSSDRGLMKALSV
jgi:hypothetical protein